jgi:hypothetical protein
MKKMKKIENEKLANLYGGGFVDGVCGAAGIARLAIWAGWMTLNPIGVTLVAGTLVGCTLYYLADK